MRNLFRTAILIGAMAPMGGCAASAAGLGRTDVDRVIHSSKSAQAFATCLAEAMQGSNELRGSGNHWWVMRSNGWGAPIVRWDFTDQATGGSLAELRSNAITGAAMDKARDCA